MARRTHQSRPAHRNALGAYRDRHGTDVREVTLDTPVGAKAAPSTSLEAGTAFLKRRNVERETIVQAFRRPGILGDDAVAIDVETGRVVDWKGSRSRHGWEGEVCRGGKLLVELARERGISLYGGGKARIDWGPMRSTIRESTGARCFYCWTHLGELWHVEHYVARRTLDDLVEDGAMARDRADRMELDHRVVVPACMPCNRDPRSGKGVKTPKQLAAESTDSKLAARLQEFSSFVVALYPEVAGVL